MNEGFWSRFSLPSDQLCQEGDLDKQGGGGRTDRRTEEEEKEEEDREREREEHSLGDACLRNSIPGSKCICVCVFVFLISRPCSSDFGFWFVGGCVCGGVCEEVGVKAGGFSPVQ